MRRRRRWKVHCVEKEQDQLKAGDGRALKGRERSIASWTLAGTALKASSWELRRVGVECMGTFPIT